MNTMMSDGVINIGGNFLLNPKSTVKDFLQSKLSSEIVKQRNYNYIWYFVKPQEILEQLFSVSILFNPCLVVDSLTISLLENATDILWENWSEERCLQKKRKHDHFLKKQLGQPPYQYTWGIIESVFDRHSGSSHIVIRYK